MVIATIQGLGERLICHINLTSWEGPLVPVYNAKMNPSVVEWTGSIENENQANNLIGSKGELAFIYVDVFMQRILNPIVIDDVIRYHENSNIFSVKFHVDIITYSNYITGT